MSPRDCLAQIGEYMDEREAWELLSRILDVSVPRLRLGDVTLTEEDVALAREVAQAAHRGVPPAYTLGWEDFYGRRFVVSPAVLIPRQETEELVVHALQSASASTHLVDCGTGSGCIPISCALEGAWGQVSAWEKSAAALDVAQENGRLLGADVAWHHGDVTDDTWGDWLQEQRRHSPILLTANLPYIPRHEMPSLDLTVLAEPASALDGGLHGTDIIKAWLLQVLRTSGHPVRLLLEADPANVADLTAFCSAHALDISWRADVAGLLRFCDMVPSPAARD